MIAADHDGRFELACADHFVEGEAGTIALAQSQPANARGQSLKRDPLPSHIEPAVNFAILREQLLDLRVGFVDVLRIARKRDPPEGSFAFAKERTDAGGHESGKIESVLDAVFERHLPDVVAVIKRRHTHALKV